MNVRRTARDFFLEVGIWLLFAALLIPAGVVGYVIAHSERQKTKTVIETPAMAAKALIQPAPKFSTGELAATASDDWITNGGSLWNQRYSSLDEINDSNVSQLKGVWLTHLRKSGIAAKYSAESQPLEYQGVIYVPTGQDDVVAFSVDTGEILWEYKAHLDQTISVVCCGWESRGVTDGLFGFELWLPPRIGAALSAAQVVHYALARHRQLRGMEISDSAGTAEVVV